MEFTIGEVMQITGLSRATLLYYEDRNLIRPRQEASSGYRKYSVDDLSHITFYQNIKQMNVGLSEYVEAVHAGDEKPDAAGRTDTDLFSLIARRKLDCLAGLSAYLSMLRYWDEVLAASQALNAQGSSFTVRDSYPAWYLPIDGKGSSKRRDLLKNWDEYFLQRNFSYRFSLENVSRGDFSYMRGITCYADCALPFDTQVREQLVYFPPRRCLTAQLPLDVDGENFAAVFDMIFGVLKEKQLVMCADPWGHLSIRTEENGQSRGYQFLWIPVQQADGHPES